MRRSSLIGLGPGTLLAKFDNERADRWYQCTRKTDTCLRRIQGTMEIVLEAKQWLGSYPSELQIRYELAFVYVFLCPPLK